MCWLRQGSNCTSARQSCQLVRSVWMKQGSSDGMRAVSAVRMSRRRGAGTVCRDITSSTRRRNIISTSDVCTGWQHSIYLFISRLPSVLISCFSKIHIGFTFLVLTYPGSPGKGPLNGCVCVCVWLCVPSVLWHCWFGIRNSIWPIKLSAEVLLWLSVCSKMQIVYIPACWCHRHPQTQSSFKSRRLVLLFWYRLTQVDLEKRPLNRVSSSS